MKQTNRAAQRPSSTAINREQSSSAKASRVEMHRFPRRLLILTLIILLAAFLLAGWNYLFPIILTLDTPVLAYSRASSINYSVLVRPNDFSDQTELGMDQVYTRAFTDAIAADFNYAFTTAQTADLQYRCQIDAILQMHDAADPRTILLSRTFNLLPEKSGQTAGAPVQLNEKIKVSLQDYQDIVDSFAGETNLAVTFDLALVMTVRVGTALAVEDLQVVDKLALLVPLSQPQFQLARQLPASQAVRVWRPIRYQLALTPVPFAVYPAAAGVCLVVLILVLVLTRSRPKNRFRLQLRRMLRYGHSQLMMIGDKAWEPEWCIAATDFRSMVRTARKLKHPIFCYVDRNPESPAAYFYVYYGENNYCHVFGNPAPADHSLPGQEPPEEAVPAAEPAKAAIPEPAVPAYDYPPFPDESADAIPVLPEPDTGEEIHLTDQQAQTRKFPPGSLF